MKKIIPFTNDIKFNTNIYEITSISLEHNLKLKQDNMISGDFIISGDYKINDSSINCEPFINSIPFEITLDNKYDINKLKIDIDDFNYEIINDEILRINIKVKVEGVELITLEDEIKPDIVLDERKNIENNIKIEENNDKLFKETDEEILMVDENQEKVTEVFDDLSDIKDEFVTYYVHIVRENDDIQSICNKYKISQDDIKEYNNIDTFVIGSKIIIPYINESI